MPDPFAKSCLRLSSPSLFLASPKRRLFRSGGFAALDRVDSNKALKAQHRCTTVSGFRVYSSARLQSPTKKIQARSLLSAPSECLGSRLACDFDSGFGFGLSRVPCLISLNPKPRPSLLRLRILVRSLKTDGSSESGIELENSSRSRQQLASGKSIARTANKASSSSRKVHKRAVQENESSSPVAGQSNRLGVKPDTKISEREDERSGIESFGGRSSNAVKQFGGKVVVIGSENPKSNTPKATGKSSTAPNLLKRSRLSGGVESGSVTIVREQPGDVKGTSKVVTEASSTMSSNQNSNRRKQAGDESKPKQQTEKKPKKKDFPAEAMLRRDLNNCSKDGDVLRALDIYDRSVSEGVVKWNQYNYNILLYLCSSAALGTLIARKSGTDRANAERLNLQSQEKNLDGTVPVESANGPEQQDKGSHGEAMSGEGSSTVPINLSPEAMELAAKRGFEIFEEMKKRGVLPNEATLTAVARLAVKKEDGDLAFQMVKEMAAQNIAPKLRSYSPALVTFCKSKQVEKAFEVDAHMVAAGVQPEEPELGALLQLCVEERLDETVYSLLHRLRTRVRALSPSTIASIEEWFSGEAGASAGEAAMQPDISALRHAMVAGGGGWHGLGWVGTGEWKLEWTTIDSEGFCCSCKNKLVTIDLDPKETDEFAKCVAELAFARETKANDFKRFQEWLERNGPFDAIIDGANVGLYNQNFQQGGFNFFQLNAVAQAAMDRGLVKKPPLIILHHARTKFGAANSPLGQQLLKKWSSSNTLYTTPNGSNDDWYWMYAAVRNRCLLITNDEMRDHLFQLLGNDFFPKWKERHQLRFSATTRGLEFHLPPPYSLVIQESENGSWHIPKDRGSDVDAPHEWICVTRPGLSAANAALPTSEPTTPGETVARPTQTTHDAMGDEKRTTVSPKLDSPDSDGVTVAPKRLRADSPSATLKKIRAADKKASGPVMFDI